MDPFFQTLKSVCNGLIANCQDLPLQLNTMATAVPKSICKHLAAYTQLYFDRILNYSQPCPVYKTEQDLSALRTEVSTTLVTSNYATSYVTAALLLFNLKNVNNFLTKIHAKANLSKEAAILQKEITRLANTAAKTRKTRTALEKAASS